MFPNAERKFFLIANPVERARRRHRELLSRGQHLTLEEVLAAQDERDRRDSERAVSPTRPAPDAIILDSTILSPRKSSRGWKVKCGDAFVNRCLQCLLLVFFAGAFSVFWTALSSAFVTCPSVAACWSWPTIRAFSTRWRWAAAGRVISISSLAKRCSPIPFLAGSRRLNCVPIDQEGIGIEGIRNIIARLEAGHPVLVFPEGERTHDGKMQPLKAGIALLFKRVRVPILPAGIVGAYQAWPRASTRFPAQFSCRPMTIRLPWPTANPAMPMNCFGCRGRDAGASDERHRAIDERGGSDSAKVMP